MNLLIITSHLPFPLNTGGNQAQFHFIDYLRNEMNVYIVFNMNKVNSTSSLSKLKSIWNNVTFFPYMWKNNRDRKKVTMMKLFTSLDRRLLNGSLHFSNLCMYEELSESFFEFVNGIITEKSIDLVQVDFNDYLPIVNVLPSTVKKIFIQHEIQYVRNELQLRLGKASYSQQFLLSMLKDNEIACMNKYDLVVTLTSVDKKKLIEDGVKSEIAVSPACVSPNIRNYEFKPASDRITFVGAYGHYPNRNGVYWFLEEVWPKVLEKYPNLKFSIIGKWPSSEQKIIEGKYKGVVFEGFVEDLGETLQGSIMVVPILIGSGMRMKILEAANYGCPFISTSVGVEGLDFENGEHCFIADGAESFANQLSNLLSDSNMQQQFSVRAKNMYIDRYSNSVLCKIRSSIINTLIKK